MHERGKQAWRLISDERICMAAGSGIWCRARCRTRQWMSASPGKRELWRKGGKRGGKKRREEGQRKGGRGRLREGGLSPLLLALPLLVFFSTFPTPLVLPPPPPLSYFEALPSPPLAAATPASAPKPSPSSAPAPTIRPKTSRPPSTWPLSAPSPADRCRPAPVASRRGGARARRPPPGQQDTHVFPFCFDGARARPAAI